MTREIMRARKQGRLYTTYKELKPEVMKQVKYIEKSLYTTYKELKRKVFNS